MGANEGAAGQGPGQGHAEDAQGQDPEAGARDHAPGSDPSLQRNDQNWGLECPLSLGPLARPRSVEDQGRAPSHVIDVGEGRAPVTGAGGRALGAKIVGSAAAQVQRAESQRRKPSPRHDPPHPRKTARRKVLLASLALSLHLMMQRSQAVLLLLRKRKKRKKKRKGKSLPLVESQGQDHVTAREGQDRATGAGAQGHATAGDHDQEAGLEGVETGNVVAVTKAEIAAVTVKIRRNPKSPK